MGSCKLSILHWRCEDVAPDGVQRLGGHLSILHWRCTTRYGVGGCCTYDFFQYSIGDAVYRREPWGERHEAFNTPLEMHILIRAALGHEDPLAFQYSIGDACGASLRQSSRNSICFQYSIGDARWRKRQQLTGALSRYRLSILHWRCRSRNAVVSTPFCRSFQYSIGDAHDAYLEVESV